jgi:hypothetical protein
MLRATIVVPRLTRMVAPRATRSFTSYNAAVAGLTPEQAEVSRSRVHATTVHMEL